MLKVNNKDKSGVFFVNFDHISHLLPLSVVHSEHILFDEWSKKPKGTHERSDV